MTGMSIVTVALGERTYEVVVGPGALSGLGARLKPLVSRGKVAIITDEQVAALHLAAAKASLAEAGIGHLGDIILPAGEQTKSFAHLEDVCDRLIGMEIERKDMVVALGGGVIGDLTGFAAAIVKRGLDFVQVPTTLLAQIDSSVGGKTAINTKRGKNLVGAFHQPRLVLADTAILDTLPPRELKAGYAEVVKVALLADGEFFNWLEKHGPDALSGDMQARVAMVSRAVMIKAEIVAEDERETGRRALLNLGHTFGHALEAETGFSARLLHGESVSIGMVIAATLSQRMGLITPGDLARIKAHLRATGLKQCQADIEGGPFPPERLIAHMAHDKKVADGKVTFILLRGLGDAFTTRDVDPGLLRQVLAET